MEENNESIKELIKKIAERQEELAYKKEIKKFNMPSKFKLPKGKIRKNWVVAMLINENRTMDAIRVPIEDGTIKIDGIPRISTTDYIMSWRGKPVVILPSWSLKPFSPEENYEKSVREQMTTAGRKLVIAKMKRDIVEPKKMSFGMIWWVIAIAVAGGVAWYLFKGGNFKFF